VICAAGPDTTGATWNIVAKIKDTWPSGSYHANASLIAKAPDMLHWLKEVEHYLSSRQTMGHELTAGELWLLEHIRSTIKEDTHGH
jgi:hypothetical protein